MKHCGSSARHIAVAALSVVVSIGAASAEDWRSQVDALRPKNLASGEAAVLENRERRAHAALAAIPRSPTAAGSPSGDGDRSGVSSSVQSASNGFRGHPRLRPRVVGTLRYNGYRIEKLVYESLPRHAGARRTSYLPGGVERPGAGRFVLSGPLVARQQGAAGLPGLLHQHGAAWLRRAEFRPLRPGRARRFIARSPTNRGAAGGGRPAGFPPCTRLAARSSTCSLGRRSTACGSGSPEHPEAATTPGSPRSTRRPGLAAAVPVVGTSEFFEQIQVCRPLDWYHAAEHCHFVPGLIRYANNHELLAMAAPKPVLIVAASQDESFPVAGVRNVADHGRKLYTSYGAAEKIGLVVDEAEGHGYQRTKREAAYGWWFLRWLFRRCR